MKALTLLVFLLANIYAFGGLTPREDLSRTDLSTEKVAEIPSQVSPSQLHPSDRSSITGPSKRYKLKFRKKKRERSSRAAKNDIRHPDRNMPNWNKRANWLILLSWIITVLGMLAFLLGVIGGLTILFTTGLVAIAFGLAGLLAGLIWGLIGKDPKR